MPASVLKELNKLLKMAADSGVVTAIAPQSPLAVRPCHPSASPTSLCAKAHRIRRQLTNLMESSSERSYQDVMQYPERRGHAEHAAVLYCGGFRGVRFHGFGTMYYEASQSVLPRKHPFFHNDTTS